MVSSVAARASCRDDRPHCPSQTRCAKQRSSPRLATMSRPRARAAHVAGRSPGDDSRTIEMRRRHGSGLPCPHADIYCGKLRACLRGVDRGSGDLDRRACVRGQVNQSPRQADGRALSALRFRAFGRPRSSAERGTVAKRSRRVCRRSHVALARPSCSRPTAGILVAEWLQTAIWAKGGAGETPANQWWAHSAGRPERSLRAALRRPPAAHSPPLPPLFVCPRVESSSPRTRRDRSRRPR